MWNAIGAVLFFAGAWALDEILPNRHLADLWSPYHLLAVVVIAAFALLWARIGQLAVAVRRLERPESDRTSARKIS